MLTPRDEAELSGLLRAANAPLRVTGGGTRTLGRMAECDVLSTDGLSGVTLYEPGAMTLVVRSGTPLAEVVALLAGENQQLAFAPPDWRVLLGRQGTSTVGGVVAANAAGSRRIQSGACRDHLLGVRFVDGAGHIISNGGRVMKNVTGYDLVRLLAGSRGTLGVMTEVSLKVLPRAEAEGTLTIAGLDPQAAVGVMSQALGSPYDVSGAAHLPRTADGPMTSLRVEGFAASVTYRLGQLAALFGKLAVLPPVMAEASENFWRELGDVAPFHGHSRDVWRLSVKPGDAPGLVARLPDGAQWFLDWGGGLVWVLCAAGRDLRADLGSFAGHATRVKGDAPTPAFHPEPPAVAALSRALRGRFDPRGILNPGLMD
jgi:glycolate oxidase FAD binding subunit